MFLRSVFALPFLPPRQLLNLLSEATPKASIEDNNSPSSSHSADGSASLETFLGTGPRSGNQSAPVHLGTPPCHPFQGGHRATARLEPQQATLTLSLRAPSLTELLLAPAELLTVGTWDVAALFFSEEEGLSMWAPAWPCQLAG